MIRIHKEWLRCSTAYNLSLPTLYRGEPKREETAESLMAELRARMRARQ